MNDQQFEKKVSMDTANVREDLNTLVGDGGARINRFEDRVSRVTGKAKADITTWVEGGVSQLSGGFDKFTGDARTTAAEAAATVKRDVGHGLSEYNAKAQEVADKVPGSFGHKAASYPWVTVSIALVAGFLLGFILRPARQALEQF